jgi:hypothetical protein
MRNTQKLSKCKKCFSKFYNSVRVKVLYITESYIFTILIFLCSIFSMFGKDIQLLVLSPKVDETFTEINNYLFVIFALEFILATMFEENYFGTFFFFLDFLSVISLVPDTDFIWSKITNSMSVEGLDDPAMTTLFTNSSLMQAGNASQAGAK